MFITKLLPFATAILSSTAVLGQVIVTTTRETAQAAQMNQATEASNIDSCTDSSADVGPPALVAPDGTITLFARHFSNGQDGSTFFNAAYSTNGFPGSFTNALQIVKNGQQRSQTNDGIDELVIQLPFYAKGCLTANCAVALINLGGWGNCVRVKSDGVTSGSDATPVSNVPPPPDEPVNMPVGQSWSQTSTQTTTTLSEPSSTPTGVPDAGTDSYPGNEDYPPLSSSTTSSVSIATMTTNFPYPGSSSTTVIVSPTPTVQPSSNPDIIIPILPPTFSSGPGTFPPAPTAAPDGEDSDVVTILVPDATTTASSSSTGISTSETIGDSATTFTTVPATQTTTTYTLEATYTVSTSASVTFTPVVLPASESESAASTPTACGQQPGKRALRKAERMLEAELPAQANVARVRTHPRDFFGSS